jgi:hypothetical protein
MTEIRPAVEDDVAALEAIGSITWPAGVSVDGAQRRAWRVTRLAFCRIGLAGMLGGMVP